MQSEILYQPFCEATLVFVGRLYSFPLSSSATGIINPSKPEILKDPPVVTKMVSNGYLGFDKNKKVITPTIKTKRIAPPEEMNFLFDKICINLDCPS